MLWARHKNFIKDNTYAAVVVAHPILMINMWAVGTAGDASAQKHTLFPDTVTIIIQSAARSNNRLDKRQLRSPGAGTPPAMKQLLVSNGVHLSKSHCWLDNHETVPFSSLFTNPNHRHTVGVTFHIMTARVYTYCAWCFRCWILDVISWTLMHHKKQRRLVAVVISRMQFDYASNVKRHTLYSKKWAIREWLLNRNQCRHLVMILSGSLCTHTLGHRVK